jgi:aerobic carbon-monoxide dehydrogenase small subunit
MKIEFYLNEETVTVDAEHSKRLLDVLREDLHQISVKEGCGEGECGSCSVLMDGKLVNSCLIAVANIEGCHILTLEGYRKTQRFDAVKKGFEKSGSVQCGFCTPGFVLAAEALLSTNPDPSAAEVMKGIEGNLCRCTGYQMIVDGILAAKEIGKGLW